MWHQMRGGIASATSAIPGNRQQIGNLWPCHQQTTHCFASYCDDTTKRRPQRCHPFHKTGAKRQRIQSAEHPPKRIIAGNPIRKRQVLTKKSSRFCPKAAISTQSSQPAMTPHKLPARTLPADTACGVQSVDPQPPQKFIRPKNFLIPLSLYDSSF
jgi:hypothetical protein